MTREGEELVEKARVFLKQRNKVEYGTPSVNYTSANAAEMADFAQQVADERVRGIGVKETCENGHDFIKLPNHPTKNGLARCPYCLSIGFDKLLESGKRQG
jgi:hypothetical protein